jgi:carboxyl-terminal processing protease
MKKHFLSTIALLSLVLASSFGFAQTTAPQAPAGPVINQPAHPDHAPASPAPSQTTPSAAKPQTAPAAEQFDGAKVYHAAFEQIRDLHIKIDSPDKVEQFTKDWEHKFDNSAELKTEKGTDKAILQMMQSLGQRFDYYFNREQTQAEHDEIESTLTGIGATLRLNKLAEIAKTLPKDAKVEDVKKAIAISQDNNLQIDEPMEGSPSEKAGLKPGDIIRKVDGKDINGMQMDEAVKLIKGQAGTAVKLTIERSNDGKTETLDVSITRARVTVPDVKVRDLGDGVTYVKLRDFMSKNAVQEMYAALKKAANGKALILDLRGNPGGSLPAVLTMAGMLLEDGPVLVTRSRTGERIVESEITLNKNFVIRTEPSDDDPDKTEVGVSPRTKLLIPNDMPIIVLVDEGSASASEILSGVLQHNRRALIVGMPTVGKGVGQTVVQLPFGRSMHVTSFEFIPGRTPNDWIGVIPNVKVERGDDPKVDKQLDKAKELILPMIKSVEENRATRDEQLKKHHDEFDKVLEQRNKKK